MSDKRTILVVEDEKAISNFISRALTANDYSPVTATTAKDAVSLFFTHHPDLVLLDLGLPDQDGMDLLVEFKELAPGAPIIVVSARDRESEKVRALDLGADDYITKPFGVSELLARIRATLRHADRLLQAQDSARESYRVGDLLVDIRRHQVFVSEQEIHFTQNEFKILELLCLHAGKVLTYDRIFKLRPQNTGRIQKLKSLTDRKPLITACNTRFILYCCFTCIAALAQTIDQ